MGVNVIVTPTIYTFAQLQNFFLWTAIEKDLETYFWSHMDIIPITFEQGISASNGYAGHQTIYQHAVEVLRSAQSADPDPNASDPSKPWAMRFFAFDYLALVNRAAFESVGGFDTTIPFYHTDCDMYARLLMAGYGVNEPRHLMTTFGNDFAGTDKFGSGIIYDIAHSIDDLIVLYRKKSRKHGGEQSITVKQAHEQEEAHRKVEGNQKQAATDDDDAQAYTKAMEEQVPFGNKAEAQNEGYIKATPKADVDTSDSDVQQASKIHQGWQGAKDAGGKRTEPHGREGSFASRFFGHYFKSLEGLHRDATAKKSTTLFSSTSLDSNSKWVTDEPGSPAYFHLLQVATNMVLAKYSQGAEGRNEWQHLQPGGKDEPYYRHAEGFEKALQLTIEMGRRVYLEKWGTLDCELIQGGFTLDDEWKPEEGSELV
ncbi:735d7e0b-0453-49a3-818b-ea81822aaded [Sclerotinia trifoliorum]|uniref:735d7e0b-0453-49a3-818b-ea81822aaded n=1 Tax=Sclerotinia trifoliorum TaxID=28548 RepID=A0A8H2W4Z2_9HELO|nr:735d7e0b-0453-49a3-818b-ea81822aaded [Sclerotinia trifoliorum]